MRARLQPLRRLWQAGWRVWWPAPLAIDATERGRVVLGAWLGLLLTGALSWHWLQASGAWLVAPLGASTVLVFAVPASPLAQPWSVVGGNTLSALVGIACAAWLPWPVPAAALAVALAIALMLALRCLHPPGGAAALLTVLGHVTDWHFALAPVLLNSALLVLAGVLYNQLTGRAYPHAAAVAATPTPAASESPPRFSEADLDDALRRYNQVLDVPRDDLRVLLEQAEQQAWRRRMQRLHCGDIMTPDPLRVMFGSPLQEAWTLLMQHPVKALPVVDRYDHVVGIVTRADFVRAAGAPSPRTLQRRLDRLLRPTPHTHARKPEVVGQIMTRQVRVVSAERPLADLVPVFSATGHHHLPVIGPGNRLVGMVTQTELIAALLQRQDIA